MSGAEVAPIRNARLRNSSQGSLVGISRAVVEYYHKELIIGVYQVPELLIEVGTHVIECTFVVDGINIDLSAVFL